MNRIFFFTFVTFLMAFSTELFSQENRPSGPQGREPFDRGAFETRRNAFITAEMGLTPEEAAAFIPLADELRQKTFEVGNDCRRLQREVMRRRELTDTDYLKMIDECVEVKMKEAQLEREYYEQFKKILPPGKLMRYRDAENKFARFFMENRGGAQGRFGEREAPRKN